MDAQDANPETPKRPAPPIQGGHRDLRQFPGLAPWAVLPDPCGVPFDFLTGSPGLFLAQRVDGIDACGPAGRQGAGRQGGQGQDKKDQGEHQRIHWPHSI